MEQCEPWVLTRPCLGTPCHTSFSESPKEPRLSLFSCSGAEKEGQDQQLDCPAFKNHSRLSCRQQQDRSGECPRPFRNVRLTPGQELSCSVLTLVCPPLQSKGGILSKACDYIRELRQTNQRMQETFKEAERLQMDNELLRQQVGTGLDSAGAPRAEA